MSTMTHNQSYSHRRHHQHQYHPELSHQVAKTTTAVTLGGSLMILSSLTMAATIIGLVLVTPLLVIFSPVLIPAIFTLFMIFAGFLTSGWLVATATFILYWMYRYVTGKHPVFADQLDWARDRIAGAVMEVKQKAEELGHDRRTVKEGGRNLY